MDKINNTDNPSKGTQASTAGSRFNFSDRSNLSLSSVHKTLQQVAQIALSFGVIDFAVTEGHRPKAAQDRYFDEGKSKVRWPNSMHNRQPSLAIDCVPFVAGKLSWDHRHCLVLVGAMLAAAAVVGADVRSGADWDRDAEYVTDQNFQDLVHFELKGGSDG